MFTQTSRLALIAGTVVVLAIVGSVTYLVADGKLAADTAVNVFFTVLAAVGIGGAAHMTATAITKSQQGQ